MNEIKIFENEQFGKVRIAMNENNETLFCLSDVCSVIGIANARNVKTRLEEDDVHQVDTIDSLGRNQQVTFVTESGLYDVIIRSDSEKAKPFRKWITSEVLPSIRKTGGYVNDSSAFVDSYFSDLDDSAKQFLVQTLESKKKLLEENKQKQKRIEEMKPKEDFYDTVVGSDDTIDMRKVAATLNIKGVGRNKLFEILREKEVIDRKNIPYQSYINRGYFRTIETSYMKGDISCIYIKTVVFQKGVEFIKKVVLSYLDERE